MRYSLGQATGLISAALLASYQDLPPDAFLKGDRPFRYRAFGSARVKGNRFLWDDSVTFFQDEELNGYAGGVQRKFAPLPETAVEFAEAFVNSAATRRIVAAEEFGIGCHQIRIVADEGLAGLPAPEGFHQDGFDVVGVTCVATENVSGGISLVQEAAADGETVLERVMSPGETLFLSDREVLHYVTPINPKVPGLPAWRDVMVVTFSLDGGAEAEVR